MVVRRKMRTGGRRVLGRRDNDRLTHLSQEGSRGGVTCLYIVLGRRFECLDVGYLVDIYPG